MAFKAGTVSDSESSNSSPDLGELRKVDAGRAREIQAGDAPALVLVQGENRITLHLTQVRGVVVALTDGAADLAASLANSKVHHA